MVCECVQGNGWVLSAFQGKRYCFIPKVLIWAASDTVYSEKTSLYFEMVFTASTLYVLPELRQLYAFILYPAAKCTINL